MSQGQAIIRECKLQAESCLYTSTGFFLWLRASEWQSRLWNALPIVFGGVAALAWTQQSYPAAATVLALLAGLLPAIYEKLNIKAHTEEMVSQAGQYKKLGTSVPTSG